MAEQYPSLPHFDSFHELLSDCSPYDVLGCYSGRPVFIQKSELPHAWEKAAEIIEKNRENFLWVQEHHNPIKARETCAKNPTPFVQKDVLYFDRLGRGVAWIRDWIEVSYNRTPYRGTYGRPELLSLENPRFHINTELNGIVSWSFSGSFHGGGHGERMGSELDLVREVGRFLPFRSPLKRPGFEDPYRMEDHEKAELLADETLSVMRVYIALSRWRHDTAIRIAQQPHYEDQARELEAALMR